MKNKVFIILVFVLIVWFGLSVIAWLAWNTASNERHTLMYEMTWPIRLIKWLWFMLKNNLY